MGWREFAVSHEIFYLAVHRLVKDPALKQAGGFPNWFKVASMAFHGAIPGIPPKPGTEHHQNITAIKFKTKKSEAKKRFGSVTLFFII